MPSTTTKIVLSAAAPALPRLILSRHHSSSEAALSATSSSFSARIPFTILAAFSRKSTALPNSKSDNNDDDGISGTSGNFSRYSSSASPVPASTTCSSFCASRHHQKMLQCHRHRHQMPSSSPQLYAIKWRFPHGTQLRLTFIFLLLQLFDTTTTGAVKQIIPIRSDGTHRFVPTIEQQPEEDWEAFRLPIDDGDDYGNDAYDSWMPFYDGDDNAENAGAIAGEDEDELAALNGQRPPFTLRYSPFTFMMLQRRRKKEMMAKRVGPTTVEEVVQKRHGTPLRPMLVLKVKKNVEKKDVPSLPSFNLDTLAGIGLGKRSPSRASITFSGFPWRLPWTGTGIRRRNGPGGSALGRFIGREHGGIPAPVSSFNLDTLAGIGLGKRSSTSRAVTSFAGFPWRFPWIGPKMPSNKERKRLIDDRR